MIQRASQESIELERRAEPTQRRAQERIDLILAAAEKLLATTPADKITTSSIAAEAGVPVSSIYRYFPNVFAIYKDLFEALTATLHLRVALIVDDPAIPDWRARHVEVMQALRGILSDNPAYRPLFQLMLTTRELRAVKEQANSQIAAHLAARWSKGLDGFHDGDPLVVARMATEIFTAFEGLTSGQEQSAYVERLFAEVEVALERYLSGYLA